MNQEKFEKTLDTIPTYEKIHFTRWYIAFQDAVEWEQFKNEGYQHIVNIKKDNIVKKIFLLFRRNKIEETEERNG